jgi:membrane protein
VADRPWWDNAIWSARDYVRRVWESSREDNVFFLASGIAFNILLAAIPFALLVITGFTYLLPKLTTLNPSDAARQFIGGFLPEQAGGGAALVYSVVDDVMRTRGTVTVYSAFIFAWLSTRLFSSLRTALADVFDIERERSMLRGVIFDLQITVVATVLFAISQIISGYLLLGTTRGMTALTELGLRQDFVGGFGEFVGRSLGFSVITLMFFALYKFLPVRRVRTRTALLAAAFSGVGFEVAKVVFKAVVGAIDVSSLYTGTIAVVAITVAWVYYAAVIFLVGGEVGQVYELRRIRRLQTF